MHQPPLPPPCLLPCKYWLVPNPTSKLREQNVSIQFPVQLSDPFKSDNFPNLGGRSLHHQSNLPFANSQFSHTISLKKVSSLLDSLHPSPVHWVIKIVISFAESLSCHLSRLFSSSSHVSIAAPILPFILWPRPAWMGWILSVWFSGSM